MPIGRAKYLYLSLALALCSLSLKGQSKYWVFFKDKDTSGFNPYTFFDAKAIERRRLEHISLYAYTDIPVKQAYVKQLADLSDSVGNVSRWFNGMGVWATSEQLEVIRRLPFVREIRLMLQYSHPASYTEKTDTLAEDSISYRYHQIQRLEGQRFANKGINGKGIRIAVLDVGFRGADKHPAFKVLFQNGQILKTHDFIKKDDFVYGYGSHGTMVLSCIAGRYHDAPMGLAPAAEFLLARTERGITELKEEEDSWVAAAEWADQNGADIISTSLGYTYQRYFIGDMNGHTSIISQGANMAARKGILVIAAAGNDGSSHWKYICTPGDADSVLTVGGTDPVTNYHISFSSYGPTSDGRLKPNVVAPAECWVATPKDYNIEEGTSFATPLVAGFAACVKQLHPEYKVMQLFREIEKSGELYPYYDYAHGYGIPQAGYFTGTGYARFIKNTFRIIRDSNQIRISVQTPIRDSVDSVNKAPKLYYHVADSNGYLLRYGVVKVKQKEVMTLDQREIPRHGYLRIYYDGYFEERKF